MKKPKFTEGEWLSESAIVYIKNGPVIADCDQSDRVKDHEKEKANAYLIAAAPEMYSVLEGMLKSISDTGSVNGFECAYAERVLAKARGE